MKRILTGASRESRAKKATLFAFLCSLCFLLFNSPASAADQIVEATITVTNFSGIATNGTATLTVNGDTRTATNNIAANPGIYFLGTNSMLFGKTNLYNHVSLYPFGAGSTRLTLINIGTNSFKLRGQVNQAISASVGGVWGTASLSTNTITNFTGVTVPLEYYSAPEATNIAYELTRFFAKASNAVPATAQGLSNHLNQFEQQQASNKVFHASTNAEGAILDARRITGTNAAITNVVLVYVDITGVTNLSGFLRALTNGYMTNVVIETDATNRFGKILIPSGGAVTIGSTSSPPNFASSSFQAIGQAPILYLNGFSDTAGNKPLLLIQRARGGEGNATNVQAGDTIGWIDILPRGLTVYRAGLHIVAEARGDISDTSSAILGTISVGKTNSGSSYQLVMGFTATDLTNNVAVWYNSNLTALATAYFSDARIGMGYLTNVTGWFGQITATNLTAFSGTLSNMLNRESTYSNTVFVAGSTNAFRAGADISFGRSAVTSVANGHNTIDVGTNVYVDLTGSPTAAWTWGGITGGNRDGKLLKIRNSTGYSADIIHNSGTEPTASLRITTPTTTNITLVTSGWAEFLYDASASRWQLVNVFNTATPAASATNALAFLATNSTQVSAALTNLNLVEGVGGNVQILATNASGTVGVQFNAYRSVFSNGTAVASLATNVDLINGSNNIARLTNSNGKVSVQISGEQAWRPIFTMTNSVTVTNTTSATSLITNSLYGTNIIPANMMVAGRTLHFWCSGYFTSASGNICETGIRFNNANLICTNLLAYSSALVADYWEFEVFIRVGSSGASGSVMGLGKITRPTASGVTSSASIVRVWKGVFPTAVTVDTTVDQVFDAYFTPGATTHGLTIAAAFLEINQ